MSRYGVMSIELGIVGDGVLAGMKAVIVTFSGCNLWDGNPLARDRGEGACSQWCDASFAKGETKDAAEILAAMSELWPPMDDRWCVLTGGEPCMQIDAELMSALTHGGWLVSIETNGTVENDAATDAEHIVWSPKLSPAREVLSPLLAVVHEVRVILPGVSPGKLGWSKPLLIGVEILARDLWPGVPLFVQPQRMGATLPLTPEGRAFVADLDAAALRQCIAHVLDEPTWRLAAPRVQA